MQKSYENQEIKVLWNASQCIHSTNCWKQLSQVFQPTKRPWVNLDGDSTENIKKQIDKCPSGALSYEMKNESSIEPSSSATVQMLPDGPMIIAGTCVITHSDGRKEEREGNTALCRCGASANKPFCDGSHRAAEFKG